MATRLPDAFSRKTLFKLAHNVQQVGVYIYGVLQVAPPVIFHGLSVIPVNNTDFRETVFVAFTLANI